MKRKLTGLVCTVLAVCLWAGFALAEVTDISEHTEHTWETRETTDATCGEAAFTHLVCTYCGEERFVRGEAATGAHCFGDDGVCTVCGYVDMQGKDSDEMIQAYGYFLEDTDGSGTYSTGDIVHFGRYPQALVTEDDAVYPALQALEDGEWQDYGYYSEGEQTGYMRYLDAVVDDTAYRAVTMDAYRPYYTGLTADAESSYIDDSGYALGKAYWFRVEPITWNVLEYRAGRLLLNSRYCLDAQPFQDLYSGNRSKMVIPGTDIFVNDWEACSVRAFLNGTFLATAFTENEAARISEVTLNNRTTGYEVNAKFQVTQHDTVDRIFLLAFADMVNTDYGYPEKASFDLETNGADINEVEAALNRRRSYTDYAAIQGCRPSTQGVTAQNEPACYYMLRSTGSVKFAISGVSKYGSASYQGSINPTSKASQDGLAFNGDFGLLPALYLQVK